MARQNGCSAKVFIDGEPVAIETIGSEYWFPSKRGSSFTVEATCPASTAITLSVDGKEVRTSLVEFTSCRFDRIADADGNWREMRFAEPDRRPGSVMTPDSFGLSVLRLDFKECVLGEYTNTAAYRNNFQKATVGKACVSLGEADTNYRVSTRSVTYGKLITSITLHYGPRGLVDDMMFKEEERQRAAKRPGEPSTDEPAAKRAKTAPTANATNADTIRIRVQLMPGDTLPLDVDPLLTLVELRNQLEMTAPTRLPLHYIFFNPRTNTKIDLKDEKLTMVRSVAPDVYLRVAPKGERAAPAAGAGAGATLPLAGGPEVICLD